MKIALESPVLVLGKLIILRINRDQIPPDLRTIIRARAWRTVEAFTIIYYWRWVYIALYNVTVYYELNYILFSISLYHIIYYIYHIIYYIWTTTIWRNLLSFISCLNIKLNSIIYFIRYLNLHFNHINWEIKIFKLLNYILQ